MNRRTGEETVDDAPAVSFVIIIHHIERRMILCMDESAGKISLSDHFTTGRLLRFAFPSIIMMIFTSIYDVVDGFFISNYVGKTEFAACCFIWPVIMAFGAVGFMIGTGGSALHLTFT